METYVKIWGQLVVSFDSYRAIDALVDVTCFGPMRAPWLMADAQSQPRFALGGNKLSTGTGETER